MKTQVKTIFISIAIIILTACKIVQAPASPTSLLSSTASLTPTHTPTITPSVTPALTPVATNTPTPTATQEPQSSSPSTNPTIAISAGGTHVCSLLANGEVICWGNNSDGQLGDGTYSSSSVPVKVIGLDDIVAIAAGGRHTCAITESASVKCWGYNYFGQLGDGTRTMSNTPVDVTGLSDPVILITAGFDHTCAITETGVAKCWGKNLFGRLGGESNSLMSRTPENVIGLKDVPIYLSADDEHTCALLKTGGVQCWGRNTSNQLGIAENKKVSKKPMDVVNLESGATTITTGFSKSCAILISGEVKCWGWIGSSLFLDVPTEVNEISNAVSIAAGGGHICVVTEEGDVYCLGENSAGQLGNQTNSDSFSLVRVDALNEDAKTVVASFDFTCVLMKSGSVKCWGDNTSGQLGDGTEVSSSIPVDVQGLSK